MKYTPSTCGFYLPEIHGKNIPADAVEITDAQYAALLDGQEAGQIITAGEDGMPVLVDPAKPSIDDIRAQGVSAMANWIAQFLSQFTAGVSPAELASWSVKAERARQHLAGSPQPMIVAEATITGEDADELAAKIFAKSAAYEAIISRTTGLRRATETAIAQAETPEVVAAVLSNAQTKATEMAAKMGLPTTQ
jgi:hypothetical protein